MHLYYQELLKHLPGSILDKDETNSWLDKLTSKYTSCYFENMDVT